MNRIKLPRPSRGLNLTDRKYGKPIHLTSPREKKKQCRQYRKTVFWNTRPSIHPSSLGGFQLANVPRRSKHGCSAAPWRCATSWTPRQVAAATGRLGHEWCDKIIKSYLQRSPPKNMCIWSYSDMLFIQPTVISLFLVADIDLLKVGTCMALAIMKNQVASPPKLRMSIYFHLPKLLSYVQDAIQKDVEDGGVPWGWKPLISKPGPPDFAIGPKIHICDFSLHHSQCRDFNCDHGGLV